MVLPDNSYWTLDYALSLKGASKLLDSSLLARCCLIDKCLPIMFNQYPNHYTGQPGYISDTGTSTIWDDEAVVTYWERGRD
ncbi:unnamed protein product [Boreogadus saida]